MSSECGHETFMGQCIDCVAETKEEAKMDELKVYTGKETVKALLEGKILQSRPHKYQYKMSDTDILTLDKYGEWLSTLLSIKSIMELEFTEVATPQVGDWVRVTVDSGKTYTGKLTSISSEGMKAKWNDNDYVGYLKFKNRTWEILSPEQVSEYKREQAFVKVGRKPNEFKSGDIVFIESIMETAVVVSNVNTDEVKVHVLNKTNGFKAKPHQIRPISFVEHQVNLG